MKFNNLRAFEKHLSSAAPNHLCHLYLILGKESFDRNVAFNALKKSFFKGPHPSTTNSNATNLQIFDADRISGADLMGELNAGVLFAGKRIVLLQDADKLDKASMNLLEGYFEKPNPSICLVVSAAAINHSTNFYKKGEKTGIVLELAEEKPWEKEQSIHAWIAATVAAEGKQIAAPAIQQLVKLLGMQQSTLHSELQKLLCYVGERKEIQVQDIAAIVSPVAVETGWQLSEAVFRRDAAAALRISKAMLLDGVPLILLLRQLRSQFQTGFQVCTILAQGGSGADVSKQFAYMKGSILERNMETAQNYGLKRYKEGLLKIDDAELQSKNGTADAELLAELAIIKLTE